MSMDWDLNLNLKFILFFIILFYFYLFCIYLFFCAYSCKEEYPPEFFFRFNGTKFSFLFTNIYRLHKMV
jgi:hypothetical protein